MKVSSLSSRHHHIDALRAALMSYGVLLHSCTLGKTTFGEAIIYLSSLVRMEAFFIVSGYVTSLLLVRHGKLRTLRSRCFSIGIPLVISLMLLNPITNYLVYIYHNSFIEFSAYILNVPSGSGPMVWHLHLWFLFPLLVYSLLTPGLSKMSEYLAVAITAISRKYQYAALLAVIVIMCVVGRGIASIFLKDILVDSGAWFITRETCYNIGFFVFGMVLSANPYIYGKFLNSQKILTLIFLMLVMAMDNVLENRDGSYNVLMRTMFGAVLSILLSSYIFSLAYRFFDDPSATARVFSNSSYTIYIFHYIFIYCFALVFERLSLPTNSLIILVALCSFALLVFFHHYVISRSKLLALIFNGRKP